MRYLLSCILFLVLLISTRITHAQQVLFFDDFSEGHFNAWTITDDPQPRSGPSDWQVINGELWQRSNIWSYDPPAEFIYHMGTHASAGDQDWTDYTLNAILRSTDNDGIGIIVRYQDPRNYYRILLMNDAGNSGSVRSPIQRIQKIVNGEPTTLVQNVVDMAYPSGYFSLTMDVRGDIIRVFLDGMLIGEAVDSTFRSGKIGLLSYANAGSVYDDVMVTSDFYVYPKPDKKIVYPVVRNRKPYLQQVSSQHAWISWQSIEPVSGRVEYGTEKGAYTAQIIQERPMQMHTMQLTDLQPGTRYFYRVFSGDRIVSEDYSFVTAPSDDQHEEWSFMVLGDSGTGNQNQRNVRDEMVRAFYREHPQLLIHVGDVHQGNGAAYDEIYFDIYEELLQQMPFFLAIGNHDTYTDNAEPFLQDFVTPLGDHPKGRYYAHRWGNVYFVNMDSNLPLGRGTAQYDFLIRTLTSEARDGADWTVLYFHHPPYSVFWPAWEGDLTVRRDLMPVFEQFGVDIVFNGHTHSYEYGAVNGVHYVISGGGGGNLDPFGRTFPHVAFAEAVHHFGMVHVRPESLSFEAISATGQLVHTFSIEKTVASVVGEGAILPTSVQLHQNYPNPFNPTTQILVDLPESTKVRLSVYTLLGQQVATLADGELSAGTHRVTFNAGTLSSGVYVYVLETPDQVIHRQMTVMK